MLLYPGVSSSFTTMIFSNAVTTPLFYYSLIPLLTLSALIVVTYKDIGAAFGLTKTSGSFTSTRKQET
jgi:hypothetical protein